MKKFFISIICATAVLFSVFYADKISSYITGAISDQKTVVVPEKNEYAKKNGFMYVNSINEYIPYSYNDLLNIIFTSINNGFDSITFYCPSEYTNCVSDMEKISDDSLVLTHINNFVHPYNSFTNIETVIYEQSKEITLNINHVYTAQMINEINEEVDKIIKNNIDNNKSDYENLKKIHDYIINTTKYDESYNSNDINNYSNSAYGIIKNHLAICNGYSDFMAIILSKLGYTNYKIAATPDRISYESNGHVWNAVYIDNKWYHIDLTWDDPVSSDGKDNLYHKYFLVSTEDMKKADDGNTVIEEHNFDPSIYLEFNESINDIIPS